MENTSKPTGSAALTGLTCVMFLMFAMTTDSAGVIIPQIIRQFRIGLAEAGAFHYAVMAGIALSGLGLGFLADRLGRKVTILLGLGLYAVDACLFIAGDSFAGFFGLLFVSGAAVGIFKTGALALIGDLAPTARAHTRLMNLVEGCFGIGAIIGPAIVTQLILSGVSWRWLYLGVGLMGLVLFAIAASARYPAQKHSEDAPASFSVSLRLLRDPHALAFSLAAMVYVGVEAAIYVWMPTLLAGYHGSLAVLALYALPVFFALRAAGRFVGSALLARWSWTRVLTFSTGAILCCFMASLAGGVAVAVVALPVSGLFMSVIYPTLNSKGISCFVHAEQGAASGVILFFTCVGAVIAPLAMGWVSDRFGGAEAGFALAAVLAALLFAAAIVNAIWDPSRPRLETING